MKTIVAALVGSAKPIGYAILFLFVITTVFAVMGVALFQDTFHYCSDKDFVDGLLNEVRYHERSDRRETLRLKEVRISRTM